MMRQPFFSQQKPGPVRHGNGGGDDLPTQARHHAMDALNMMVALFKNEELDPKLRFAVAKYLLELGWGRPRAMREPVVETGTTTVTGSAEAMLLAYFKETAFGHEPATQCGGDAGDDRLSGADRMEQHGAGNAADAER